MNDASPSWTKRNPGAGRRRPRSRASRGFSLLELLTVMGIIAILSALAGPAVSSFVTGGKFTRAVTAASGAFEQAREYAVAHRTYTYVGFANPTSSGAVPMAIFASRDGTPGITDLSDSGTSYVIDSGAGGTNPLVLLNRIAQLEGCEITDTIPAGASLDLKDPGLPVSDNGAQFQFASGSFGTLNFKRVVQFTPRGEARVARVTPASLRLVMIPTKGDAAAPVRDSRGTSAIRIAGITGSVTVHRP